VNGENAAPVYKFLKLGKWGIFGDNIQWNFAKFLVDKDGQIVDRYYPTTSPLSLEVKASFAVLCLFVFAISKRAISK
jgi:glutathione peroxidase